MFSESNSSIASPRYSAKRNLHHVFFFCDAPEAQQVVLAGDFNRGDPIPMRRMPDGRWMAYTSDESGSSGEVYVRPFPETAMHPTREPTNATLMGGSGSP